MKKLFYSVLTALLLSSTITFSQSEEMLCAPSGIEHVWEGQIGGYVLPSEGTINVLFIFAQFPDDAWDSTNASWPKGQAPANMQEWVDQTWSANPTQGSMTHYFNEMSFNKLKFTGKAVSVTTQNTREWYLNNNKNRGYIHREIIQKLDSTWSFAEFDNWDYNGDYDHINQPDGIVDMIFIVWRNIAHEYSNPAPIYNALNMGRYASLGGSSFTVDNGQRTIKTGFWPDTTNKIPGGSGVTLTDWFSEDMFRFCIHEFGHYLQGGNDQHVGFGFWGLLSGWGIKSYAANAFERYRLGWINLNTVQLSPTQTIQNATLPDYLTTGVAYRLVINAANSQYFYLENHQNHNRWKYPDAIIEDGLYVLRQDGASGDNTFMQCVPADGRWDWTVNQRVLNPWGTNPQYLPVFKRLGANRVDGYHDLQRIPWIWSGQQQQPHHIHFTEDPKTGNAVLDIRGQGDGKDAFRMGYNEVWSPFSNPNSQNVNKAATPYGFKLNSITNGVYSIDIYVNTSLNGPPSKPTGFSVSAVNNFAVLNWSANIENDLWPDGKYKIYRASTTGGEPTVFYYITTINAYDSRTPITSWTDPNPVVGAGSDKLFYRVTAVDNGNLESVPSDYDWVYWNQAMQKGSGSEELAIIFENKLYTNYPNPFNPSTVIHYSVKDAGLVSLKVFDILGRELALLVNDIKETGYHSVEFNASDLPSGVYIYTLQVNGYTDSKKMLLVK